MTKKIYLSEVTNDNSQLEFSVTTKGIHFDIQQEDGTYLASLTFTKNTELFFVTTYLPLLDEIMLNLRFNQIPKIINSQNWMKK